MKNSADLGGCYPPRPSACVDKTLLDLQNSSHPTQPHSIIAKYNISIRYAPKFGLASPVTSEFFLYVIYVVFKNVKNCLSYANVKSKMCAPWNRILMFC